MSSSPSTPAAGRRLAALAGGGQLRVRPMVAADVDGLADLYARLDDDGRYRRFFSMYRPDRAFVERMVTVRERGGEGLVALVREGPDDRERLVAEASFELLPNGDGELGMTVDRAWRGWLGPYLLDALLEAAAARGVPNLEADILLTNGPMLSLARARGYAAVPNGDWSVVRAVVGTCGAAPSWPGRRDRVRVLVEGAGGRWHAEGAAGAAGVDVLGCPGPEGRGRACPMLHGDPCPLAAEADVIVVSHPPDTPRWRAVREAHERLHPGVPVFVEVTQAAPQVVDGEEPLAEASAADAVTIVRRAARPRSAPEGPEAPAPRR